jgi:hypothetical protein
MASYVLTRYTTEEMDSIDDAAEALETKLETVEDSKTIHAIGIVPLNRDRQRCVGYVIYNT